MAEGWWAIETSECGRRPRRCRAKFDCVILSIQPDHRAGPDQLRKITGMKIVAKRARARRAKDGELFLSKEEPAVR